MAIVPTTRIEYAGDGVSTLYPFSFPYDQESDVYVTVDGVITPFTFSTPSIVSIVPAPANGAEIWVYRDTPASFMKYIFDTGVPFLVKFADTNWRQLLYIFQEYVNLANANLFDISRSVRGPGPLNQLPSISGRANKVLGFDSLGQPEMLEYTPDSVPILDSRLQAVEDDVADLQIAPSYARSAAEIAAGVFPSNYGVPSNIVGVNFAKRYATYADANAVADVAGIPSIGTGAGNISTNVAFGRGALKANTTGTFNIAIGRGAMTLSTTGDNNIAIGYNTLTAYVGASGSLTGQNTVVGNNSAYSVTTGGDNTVVGNNAFMEATTATYCTAIGQGALAYQAPALNYSVAVGYHALLRCKALGNVAVGAVALGSNGGLDLTGIANTAVGYFALASVTSGTTNTAMGYEAALATTTASDTTAIGHGALNANNASGLTAVGKSALALNTTGTGNTAVGKGAMQSNLTGAENTAVGENALLVSTGPNSVAIGKNALQSLTSAGNCVGVGHSALANVTGTANTSLGFETGLGITTGDSNTMLGFRANSILAAQNTTSVGSNSSCIASNQVTLGNAAISSLRCQATSITAVSDRRDKTAIEDLPLGLDFINAVKVRKYIWNRRDGSCTGVAEAGIIAQELQELQSDFDADWLGLVMTTNPERLEATPFKMFFPLIKAVQELSAKVETANATIAAAETTITTLESRLLRLETELADILQP